LEEWVESPDLREGWDLPATRARPVRPDQRGLQDCPERLDQSEYLEVTDPPVHQDLKGLKDLRAVLDQLDLRVQVAHLGFPVVLEHLEFLDLLGLRDQLDQVDLQELQEHPVYPVVLVELVLRDLLVRRVQRDLPDQLVQMVLQALQEVEDLLVLPDPLVSLELQDLRVLSGRRVNRDSRGLSDQAEHPDLQEHPVSWVTPDHRVQRALSDPREILDHQDSLVVLDHPAQSVHSDLQDQLVVRDCWVLTVHKDPKDCLVLKEHRVQLVRQVVQALPDLREVQDQQDPWVRLVLQDLLALKEVQGYQDQWGDQDNLARAEIKDLKVLRERLDP